MFNASLRITGDFAEAEDVLQESFLSAFRELHSYKGDSSFGSWLNRIVINKSINCLRNRRLQLVPLGDQHDGAAIDHDDQTLGLDPEDLSWRADVVRRCVQELPDGYRVVLSLYLLEGYDHAEIASILQITESTSKSQYSRARKKLLELARQHGL
jgi:RNA polymerase sigma-70 factor (ECF subfamily)